MHKNIYLLLAGILLLAVVAGCSDSGKTSAPMQKVDVQRSSFSDEHTKRLDECLGITVTDDRNLETVCNVGGCENIGDEEYLKEAHDFCQEHDDVMQFCEYLGEDINARHMCLAERIRESHDKNICDYFILLAQQECVARTESNGGNPAACAYIKSSVEHVFCSTVVGAEQKDASYCLAISEAVFPHRRAMCFRALARITKDASLCEMITSEHAVKDKDGCYYDAALAIGDLTLCEKVTDAAAMRFCGMSSAGPKSEYDQYLLA